MARHSDAYQELRATTAAAGHGDKGPRHEVLGGARDGDRVDGPHGGLVRRCDGQRRGLRRGSDGRRVGHHLEESEP